MDRRGRDVYEKQHTEEAYAAACEQRPPLLTLAPHQIYQATVKIGLGKARQTVIQTLLLSIFAGFYKGLGGMILTTVGGGSPVLGIDNPGLQKILLGVVGIPLAVFMIVITGSELFTSNCMYMTAGWLEGLLTSYELARSWTISFIGNFIGGVTMAYIGKACAFLPAPSMVKFAMSLSVTKTSFGFWETFLKAILANWMVCCAWWQAAGCTSTMSKFIAILLPVSTFVALGFEHSVANMYLIPQGMVEGAPVSVARFLWKNQFPVVIGNIVGGAIMTTGIGYFAFSTTESKWWAAFNGKVKEVFSNLRGKEAVEKSAVEAPPTEGL